MDRAASPPDASADQPPAAVAQRFDGLRLEAALRLLRQSGRDLPDVGGSDPLAWLQSLIDALCDLSSRDALTGLANRRQFELAIEREVDRVARTGEPTLLLVLDIDHFKQVNDSHGHAVGDQVIQAVAQVLVDCVRPMDTVARIGGEEFAIVLPNCAPAFGQTVVERIREKVAASPVAVAPGQQIGVTLSAGGAFAPPWVRSSAALWMERADRQLYRAKHSGRNCACLEVPPLPTVSAEEKGLLFALGQGGPAADIPSMSDGSAADPRSSSESQSR